MSEESEVVDPVTQLAWSLTWEKNYPDKYMERVLRDAIACVIRESAALAEKGSEG